MNGTHDAPKVSTSQVVRGSAESIGHAAEKVEKAAMFGINNSVVRTVLQGGAILLICVLFYDQSMNQKAMMSSLITKTEERHERTEQMFREEVREQRKAHWEATHDLRQGLDAVRGAVDKNTDAVTKAWKEAAEASKSAAEELRKLAEKRGDLP